MTSVDSWDLAIERAHNHCGSSDVSSIQRRLVITESDIGVLCKTSVSTNDHTNKLRSPIQERNIGIDGKKTYRVGDRQTNRQAGRVTGRQTDLQRVNVRQTDRQTVVTKQNKS